MALVDAPSEKAITLARQSARAIGLRVAAIDMFVDIGGKPDATEIIEVNSNPSIRLLEDSGRGDLILKIWHHSFVAMGLL
jgi:glutathione synthase/RimK-type ligase-like ATP-grasp enzyme